MSGSLNKKTGSLLICLGSSAIHFLTAVECIEEILLGENYRSDCSLLTDINVALCVNDDAHLNREHRRDSARTERTDSGKNKRYLHLHRCIHRNLQHDTDCPSCNHNRSLLRDAVGDAVTELESTTCLSGQRLLIWVASEMYSTFGAWCCALVLSFLSDYRRSSCGASIVIGSLLLKPPLLATDRLTGLHCILSTMCVCNSLQCADFLMIRGASESILSRNASSDGISEVQMPRKAAGLPTLYQHIACDLIIAMASHNGSFILHETLSDSDPLLSLWPYSICSTGFDSNCKVIDVRSSLHSCLQFRQKFLKKQAQRRIDGKENDLNPQYYYPLRSLAGNLHSLDNYSIAMRGSDSYDKMICNVLAAQLVTCQLPAICRFQSGVSADRKASGKYPTDTTMNFVFESCTGVVTDEAASAISAKSELIHQVATALKWACPNLEWPFGSIQIAREMQHTHSSQQSVLHSAKVQSKEHEVILSSARSNTTRYGFRHSITSEEPSTIASARARRDQNDGKKSFDNISITDYSSISQLSTGSSGLQHSKVDVKKMTLSNVVALVFDSVYMKREMLLLAENMLSSIEAGAYAHLMDEDGFYSVEELLDATTIIQHYVKNS